ncbi:hypothetical protein U1Q18_047170 [Sarracenia purpurea var. burkii]
MNGGVMIIRLKWGCKMEGNDNEGQGLLNVGKLSRFKKLDELWSRAAAANWQVAIYKLPRSARARVLCTEESLQARVKIHRWELRCGGTCGEAWSWAQASEKQRVEMDAGKGDSRGGGSGRRKLSPLMMMLNEDGSREGMEHNLKTILGSPFFRELTLKKTVIWVACMYKYEYELPMPALFGALERKRRNGKEGSLESVFITKWSRDEFEEREKKAELPLRTVIFRVVLLNSVFIEKATMD